MRGNFFVSVYCHQRCVFALRLAPIHFEPAGRYQHLAFGFELMLGNRGDARGLQELGGRVENRQKAPNDHVVELGFRLAQRLGRLQRRDDRKVV